MKGFLYSNLERRKILNSREIIKKATADHFVVENDKLYAGKHIILDLWGVNFDNNIKTMKNIFREAVKKSGATLLHLHVHEFGKDEGLSGIAVLAESHISVHTWPDKGYIALDIFMCGASFPEIAADALIKRFSPKKTKLRTIYRGKI